MEFLERRKVSPEPVMNEALPIDLRVSNLEHDSCIMMSQIAKYNDYLDKLIEKETKAAEFWDDAKATLAKNTLWTLLVALGAACWFTFKSLVNYD